MRFTTFQNRAEMCARICVVTLGISIPISVYFDNLLLAIILVLWLVSGDYRAKLAWLNRHRVALAALALFDLFAIGLAWSASDIVTGRDMLGKYLDLAFVPIFVYLFRDERIRRHAWLALAFALVLTLVLSYLTWMGLIPENPLLIGNRHNPDVFKRYLTQSILLAFGAYLFANFAIRTGSAVERWVWAILGLLATFNVLAMTDGRSGQLILFALTLYFAYSIWRWKGTALATVGIALALALMAGVYSTGRLVATPDELLNLAPGQAATSSTGYRLEFYRNSLEIVRKHPLVGTGTGSFAKEYADHVAGTAMAATVNPHNEYLNIAVQLGAIGLLMLLYLFYCEWRLAAMLPTPYERHLARALVITFIVGCLFNSLLMDHAEGLFFAWATGLLFGGLNSPQKSGASAR